MYHKHLEGDIPGSGGEVSAVVAATVALALLITVVPGRLGQFLRLSLQQLVEGFLYAFAHKSTRTSSLSCPLITSSFSCTIFSDMVCCLLSEWCVATSFYQSSANHVSFLFCETYSTLSYKQTLCLKWNKIDYYIALQQGH